MLFRVLVESKMESVSRPERRHGVGDGCVEITFFSLQPKR